MKRQHSFNNKYLKPSTSWHTLSMTTAWLAAHVCPFAPLKLSQRVTSTASTPTPALSAVHALRFAPAELSRFPDRLHLKKEQKRGCVAFAAQPRCLSGSPVEISETSEDSEISEKGWGIYGDVGISV